MSSNQEFTTPDDALAHFGVKGMKWGRRKSTNEIRVARRNVNKQELEVAKQADKVDRAKAMGKTQHTSELKKFEKMNTAFLKNPDRATAARMTNGEKFALGLITGVVAGVPGLVLAAGVAGATRARSARIAGKQEAGAYDKKRS